MTPTCDLHILQKKAILSHICTRYCHFLSLHISTRFKWWNKTADFPCCRIYPTTQAEARRRHWLTTYIFAIFAQWHCHGYRSTKKVLTAKGWTLTARFSFRRSKIFFLTPKRTNSGGNKTLNYGNVDAAWNGLALFLIKSEQIERLSEVRSEL